MFLLVAKFLPLLVAIIVLSISKAAILEHPGTVFDHKYINGFIFLLSGSPKSHHSRSNLSLCLLDSLLLAGFICLPRLET